MAKPNLLNAPMYFQYSYSYRMALHRPLPMGSLIKGLNPESAWRFWKKAVTRRDGKPDRLKRLVSRMKSPDACILKQCAKLLYEDPWLLCPADECFVQELFLEQACDFLKHNVKPTTSLDKRLEEVGKNYSLNADERELLRFLYYAATYDWCADLAVLFDTLEEALHVATGIDHARVRTLLREDAPLKRTGVLLANGLLGMEVWRELEASTPLLKNSGQ